MPGTILAFDVGTRRVGVAKADPSPAIAFPLTTLIVSDHLVADVQKVITETAPSLLVVGLPRSQSGDESEQSTYSRSWVYQFLLPLGIPVVFHDESTTSLLARERLEAQGGNYRKEDVDAVAAQIILESYLSEQGGNNGRN